MKSFLKVAGIFALSLLLLTGCNITSGSTQSTQTPVYVVVEEDQTATPQDAVPTPTVDVFPTPQLCEAGVVEQAFENGRMFWVGRTEDERCKVEHRFVPGTGEIWVIILNEEGTEGEWLRFVDNWDEDTEIESDPEVDPPDDLFQPTRGFGKVWRERLTDDQRETLGWATSPEIGYTTEYRFEAGGFVDSAGIYVERPGMHSLITFGNEVIIFDESGETAEFATEE